MVQKKMAFKEIEISRAMRAPLFSRPKPFVHFGRRYHEDENYFEFGPVFQEEIPIKGISYLNIRKPFSSVECNQLCNFGRGYYEEQFCEIILNSGQWYTSRCCSNDFLSGALAILLFGGAEPFMQF